MNARAFLRWAGVNLLLGSWDNYFATPSNYYLYNSGRQGAEDDFMRAPYFTFVPWDYDNCLGIDYFGTQWQYTDILDWPGNNETTGGIMPPRAYRWCRTCCEIATTVGTTWTTWNSCSIPSSTRERSPADRGRWGGGLWGRVCQGAYLESATPYGQPFTGRQFSNDEVYRSGCLQNELRHGNEKAEGIVHYVRMRHDSARQQLGQLRKTTPRATEGAGFPAAMEPLPPQAMTG